MFVSRKLLFLAATAAAVLLLLPGGSLRLAAQNACANTPFTDVPANICSAVTGLFFTGITVGTSPTTFSPNDNTTRGQMAQFLTRQLDQNLKRSRRGALQWWYTPRDNNFRISTTVAGSPTGIAADGADLWVAGGGAPGTITRVRASDGAVLATWTGALNAVDIVAFSGRIYAAAFDRLYSVDPTQNGGAVQTVASNLPNGHSLVFDGQFLWRVEGQNVGIFDGNGRVTAVGSFGTVIGMVSDGSFLWLVTSTGLCKHAVGDDVVAWNCFAVTGGFASTAVHPIFDGINLVIPDRDANKVVIIRASTGAVAGTITGNGLDKPTFAAFDGERIAFSNAFATTVSIFRASDFSPLGVVNLGSGVQYAMASDGLHLFVLNATNNRLTRL